MSWDAASFELGAPWHMTPDGIARRVIRTCKRLGIGGVKP